MSSFRRLLLLNALRKADALAAAIRKQLIISRPGEVIYADPTGSSVIVIAADGFGGAEYQRVEGNYPIDYYPRETKTFASEDAAIEFAEKGK